MRVVWTSSSSTFPVGKATLIDSNAGDYKVIGEMITEPKEYFGDGFGIAFRQRDEDLANAFNEALCHLERQRHLRGHLQRLLRREVSRDA